MQLSQRPAPGEVMQNGKTWKNIYFYGLFFFLHDSSLTVMTLNISPFENLMPSFWLLEFFFVITFKEVGVSCRKVVKYDQTIQKEILWFSAVLNLPRFVN